MFAASSSRLGVEAQAGEVLDVLLLLADVLLLARARVAGGLRLGVDVAERSEGSSLGLLLVELLLAAVGVLLLVLVLGLAGVVLAVVVLALGLVLAGAVHGEVSRLPTLEAVVVLSSEAAVVVEAHKPLGDQGELFIS